MTRCSLYRLVIEDGDDEGHSGGSGHDHHDMTIIDEIVDEKHGSMAIMILNHTCVGVILLFMLVSWALHVCGAPNFSELDFSHFTP